MPWAGVPINEDNLEPPPFEEVVDMVKELQRSDVPIPGQRIDPPRRKAIEPHIITVGR